MSLFSVKPLYSPSVTATNGSATVQVTGNVNCAFISSGSIVSIGSRQIVDAISGTGVDAGGNSTITLRRPWSEPTTTAPMLVFMSYEGLSESVFRLNQITEQAAVNAQNAFVFKGNYDLAAAGALPPAPSAGSEMWRIASAATVGGRAYAQGEPIYYDQYLTQWRSYWDGLGTAARRNVMTSLTDITTPDALMMRGAFGVGASVISGISPNQVNALTAGGFYTNGDPSGSDLVGYSSILHMPYSDTAYATQIFSQQGNTRSSLFVRSKNLNVWQAPDRIYTSGNIVGGVSQSAGIPTGAIIQRGGNVNGEFTRFADGTQMSFARRTSGTNPDVAQGSIFISSTQTQAYPAAFSATPVRQATLDADGLFNQASWIVTADDGSGGLAGWSVRIAASVATVRTYTYQLTAIGRWFNL